jgi:hypothetical protein
VQSAAECTPPLKRREGIGEVAKRSNAADCKSVAPAASEVRILPSPPNLRSLRELRLASQRAAAKGVRAQGWPPHPRSIARSAGLPAVAASKRSGASREGGSNSVVESQPSKLLVAGSIPVSRSNIFEGLAPLELPHAVARSAWGPRIRSGGALALLAPRAEI